MIQRSMSIPSRVRGRIESHDMRHGQAQASENDTPRVSVTVRAGPRVVSTFRVIAFRYFHLFDSNFLIFAPVAWPDSSRFSLLAPRSSSSPSLPILVLPRVAPHSDILIILYWEFLQAIPTHEVLFEVYQSSNTSRSINTTLEPSANANTHID